MARIVNRALPLASRRPHHHHHHPIAPVTFSLRHRLPPPPPSLSSSSSSPSSFPSPRILLSPLLKSDSSRRSFHVLPRGSSPFAGIFSSLRGFRKTRRRYASKKQAPPKERELELSVKICIEDDLPHDPEVMSIAEMLKLNAPMAMKIAFDGLKDSEYKTRDVSLTDVGKFEKIELSLLLCNDDFMQKLNKEWRGIDNATDVLSMSQHIPELDIPILMLGDVVVSVETAARQAEERGHTLLDEIRILMVHGLLHLLGFDHELSEEAEAEMGKEEELVLRSLGWKGSGLIKSAYDAIVDGGAQPESQDGKYTSTKKAGNLRFYKPKYKYIFCDMDGTLLNSKSRITTTTAQALLEAVSRGVNIVIATGKTRPAVISALKMANLAGKDGIVSESSPGIFLQGLLVYGRGGREIARRNLDQDVCREAFLYSLENEIPLIAFCQDRCLTLFDHPLVDSLNTIYHEPKAEIMPSVEHLLAAAEIQKLLFLDTAEGVSSVLRPHWAGAIEGRAGVVQAQPDMLEIVPPGTSKGNGVRMLLNHLGVSAKEGKKLGGFMSSIARLLLFLDDDNRATTMSLAYGPYKSLIMAIGDGENDVEMLELASLGVCLENGSEKTKAVANVIGASNDEEGVAEAIYRYAF